MKSAANIRTRRHALCLLALLAAAPVHADDGNGDTERNTVSPLELPTVVVIGVTPSSSLGIPMAKVPGNVQSASGEEIARHDAFDITQFMNATLGSVNINDDQNNPFQPDVSYRGFDASPLLGSSIGMSVYQDGVRINEPFGDVVNWDLIPKFAISNIELIPGSNPLFGLNTLGGALAVRTKSGFDFPGTSGQVYGGSFGRRVFELEHGGSSGNFDWFVAGNVARDDGWRIASSSNVNQAFGKVGWENETTDFDLSYSFAENTLNGVQATPVSQLARNYSAVFSIPDTTTNLMHFVNLQASHRFESAWELSGNAYYRENSIGTYNSDTGNLGDTCDAFAGVNVRACLDDNGNLVAQYPASNQRTRSAQYGAGASLQLSNDQDVFGRENVFAVGATYDYGHTHFNQEGQDGIINEQRATVGATPFVLINNLIARNEYIGIFATDTLSVTPWWHVTLSGRWNRANVDISDRSGFNSDINGHNHYSRFNPAAGFTLDPFAALGMTAPMKDLAFYFNYDEGLRAPSPLETTCDDPASPCTLPNSVVADPPGALQPVVARTWETGIRGTFENGIQWNASVYRTELSNDILFVNVPSATVNVGFFQNAGTTRRQGVELGLRGESDRLQWYANYSFIDATYQSSVTLQNSIGPENVKPGDRIPGIPQNTVKLGLAYQLFPDWWLGGNLLYASTQYVRGDDTNRLPQVPEYVVVGLDTRYRLTRHLELFGSIDNLFDAHYETFGIISQNFFTGDNERFLGPGAPRAGWVGLRFSF